MEVVFAIAALALIIALAFIAWRRSRASSSSAAVPTSLAGRALRLGGVATRTAARQAFLKVRLATAHASRREALAAASHLKSAEDVAAVMGQMKGVFMKLGQIASFAVEAMPPEARKVLAGLQSGAPPMDFALARGVVEAELGGSLTDHFRDFDPLPLAAASIGQVHRARLKSGEDVVVKVQYPGVDLALRNDLRFTGGLVTLVGRLLPNTDARAMVDELKVRLEAELDYRLEAENQRLFGQIWAGHPLIRVPAVHTSHSSRRVLTQGFAEGLSFDDFLAVAEPSERRLAALTLNDFVFDSMHLFGVFNGDPHPGNYLFAPDGCVTFLDFGCVKRFEGPFLADIRALNRAIIARDMPAFEFGLRATGIVLPGRPVDLAKAFEFFAYHARPFTTDAPFRFDADYVREASEVMSPATVRLFNLPPELVFFNRITFGLNAIFARLGAEENFHRLYRRYFHSEEGQPPGLAAAGVDLPARFLAPRPWPL